MEKSDPIISEENLELPPPAIPMPEVKHEEHKKFMTPQITYMGTSPKMNAEKNKEIENRIHALIQQKEAAENKCKGIFI